MKTSVASLLGKRRSHGQTAVEFALCASLFLLLTFGIIEFALVVYAYNTISNASRECVRYAIVHSSASNSQIQQVTINYARIPGFTTGNATVSWPADPNLPAQKDAQCKISYNYNLDIPFLPQRTLALTSTSRMLVSR